MQNKKVVSITGKPLDGTHASRNDRIKSRIISELEDLISDIKDSPEDSPLFEHAIICLSDKNGVWHREIHGTTDCGETIDAMKLIGLLDTVKFRINTKVWLGEDDG